MPPVERAPTERHPDGTAIRGRSVVVVGGGPAGLMAAERLARAGATVTVYERMPSVGRKLLLAGRGGLNLTHSEPAPAFLARYGAAAAGLEPALSAFGPEQLRAWCAGLGQETFVGTSGRVFPVALRATPLLRAWLLRLQELGVRLRVRHEWIGWEDGDPGGGDATTVRFRDADGQEVSVRPDAVVLALGGASWPRVGSNGAWVAPVRAAGVEVAPLRPANCGFEVEWSPRFGERFAGVPLKNVEVRVGTQRARGDAVITATGIEGGPVYAVSARLRDEVAHAGTAVLHVDLAPDLTEEALVARLSRRRPKDSVSSALRRAGFAPVAIALAREAAPDGLPRDTAALAPLLRAVPVRVVAPAPIERAISTAGGVAASAVDERSMLRARPGTFVAGEMLDWEAPTGGYLLQATFSTAVRAADGVIAWLTR